MTFTLKQKQTKNLYPKGGFLLIELIVSLFIFSIVMTVSIGSLLTVVQANKKNQDITSVLDNLNIALDSMARSIATGKNYRCSGDGLPSGPLDCWFGDTSNDHAGLVVLLNQDIDGDPLTRDFVTYGFVAGAGGAPGYITRQVGRVLPSFSLIKLGSLIRMTAPQVDITDMKFFVQGSPGLTAANDHNQAKVLIVIKGRVLGKAGEPDTNFAVQTLVSQLGLDL